MKILIALDDKDYSRNILETVARLAANTLADLSFSASRRMSPSQPLSWSISWNNV